MYTLPTRSTPSRPHSPVPRARTPRPIVQSPPHAQTPAGNAVHLIPIHPLVHSIPNPGWQRRPLDPLLTILRSAPHTLRTRSAHRTRSARFGGLRPPQTRFTCCFFAPCPRTHTSFSAPRWRRHPARGRRRGERRCPRRYGSSRGATGGRRGRMWCAGRRARGGRGLCGGGRRRRGRRCGCWGGKHPRTMRV